MESSISLQRISWYDRLRTRTSMERATDIGGMRKSASQAYFDRYPERKGQGSYAHSSDLTPPLQRNILSKDSNQKIENDVIPSRDVPRKKKSGKEKRRDVNASFESSPLSSDNYPLTNRSERGRFSKSLSPLPATNGTESVSRSTSLTPSLSSSSSISTSGGPSSSRQTRSKEMDDQTRLADAAAARSPSGYPVPMNSVRRRSSQANIHNHSTSEQFGSLSKAQGIREEQIVRRGKLMEDKQQEVDMPQRRLKAQQSMPNVRSFKEKKNVPVVPTSSWKPWPVALLNRPGTGQSTKQRSVGSLSSNSSPISSINETLPHDSPDGFTPKHSTSGINDKKAAFSTQSMTGSRWKRNSRAVKVDNDEESNSSLDSVEKEIKSIMRLTESFDEIGRPEKLEGNSTSDMLSHSPSTPNLLLMKKKSSPSILNPARRLRTLSAAISSSSLGSTDTSPTILRQSSRKYSTQVMSSSPLTISQISSPNLRPVPMANTPNKKDEEVLNYLRSKKLTTIMMLLRPPFQGLEVSFADVGDPDGHPVFVFLGLGAVRYLVGLYDEMARVLRLRLICIDRWGLGKTDKLPTERRGGVLEWSNVVLEVADRLNINRFSILAHSAGAPYAMATCLMNGPRIAGPVHLLSPWVGSTIESGYKWLKYIPDGVIKTAQAADWKMQAWKLGIGKTPFVVHTDEANRSSFDEEVQRREGASPCHSPSLSKRSLDNGLVTPLRPGNLKASRSGVVRGESPTIAELSTYDTATWNIDSEAYLSSYYNSSASGSTPPAIFGTDEDGTTVNLSANMHHNRLISMENGSNSRTFSAAHRPHLERSSSGPQLSSSELDNQSTSSDLDLTTALLRASHAENLRGGGTDDLLTILGRSSQKPWGFSYVDVKHNVIVWQGDKDERISLSSVMWMEREMQNCIVHIVKGANHSLMTNAAVVVEALESISTFR